MAQRVFKMNGRKFYSIMDMARELGLPRIYARDFGKYGIVEITGTPEADEPDSPLDEAAVTTEETKKTEDSAETTKSEKKSSKNKSDKDSKKSDKSSKKTAFTIEELVKMTIEEFSKNLRKIDTSQVIKFAEDNKLESYGEVEDERIRRMKVVMELKKKYFPNQSVPTKKASFKGVDTDTLIKFADDMKVEYKKSSEDKIQKMWVIFALNQAGFYDLPKKDGDSNNED